MNQIFQIILIVVGVMGGLGVFAGGIGYLLKTFRKGTKEEKSEVISVSQEQVNFWKSTAENYQLIMERKEREWNEKFQTMTRELGELKGKYDTEKAQSERLEKIFQNRDPESQKFMEHVVNAIENQDRVNLQIVSILKDIHALAVDEHDREMKVEATVTKV